MGGQFLFSPIFSFIDAMAHDIQESTAHGVPNPGFVQGDVVPPGQVTVRGGEGMRYYHLVRSLSGMGGWVGYPQSVYYLGVQTGLGWTVPGLDLGVPPPWTEKQAENITFPRIRTRAVTTINKKCSERTGRYITSEWFVQVDKVLVDKVTVILADPQFSA